MLRFAISRFERDLWVLALMVGVSLMLSIAEWRFPAEAGQSVRGRIRNLGFIAIFQIGGGVLVSAAAYLLLPYALLDADWLEDRGLFAHAAVIALYLFISDFVFYWYHRAQHSVAVLWPAHELHHSERELNATSSLRTYLLERPLQFIVISLPLAWLAARVPLLSSFQLTPGDANRLYLISLAWVFFVHANIRLRFGRASWLFTGPQVHRLHHSIEERHHGKNFAQFFPIIDMMFGTYQAPEAEEFPRTGVADVASDLSVAKALQRPFHLWFGRRT